jgi:hypothetical protein
MSRWMQLISVIAGAAIVWNMLTGRRKKRKRSMLWGYKFSRPMGKVALRGIQQLIKR